MCLRAIPQLVDAQSKATVAKSRNAGRDGLLRKRQLGLDVNAVFAPLLDAIVLSFIMLEAARRGSAGNKDNGDGGDWAQRTEQPGGNGSVAAIVALGAVAGAAIDGDGDGDGDGDAEVSLYVRPTVLLCRYHTEMRRLLRPGRARNNSRFRAQEPSAAVPLRDAVDGAAD